MTPSDPLATSIAAPNSLPVVADPKPPVKSAAKPPAKPPPNDPLTKFKGRSEHDPDDSRMGFIDHLLELRRRMWISIIAVIVCVVLSLVFYKQIYVFMMAPWHAIVAKYDGPAGDGFRARGILLPGQKAIEITSNEPLATMIIIMWLGFWGGIVVASPIVLYEAWAFIAPGLHASERRAIKPVLYGGTFFFLVGVALAYFFLAPVTFDFFVWFDLDLNNRVFYTAEKCIELLLTMMIVAGLLWEIPLIVAGLAKLDVLDPWWLIKYWKILTFGSVVLGAIVSPGNDVLSLSVFAGLILGIYLVSIAMAFVFHPKKSKLKT